MASSLSIGAAASAWASLSSPRIQDSKEVSGGTTGQIGSYDDGDWCPTRPPIPPRPHWESALGIFSQLDALGLQPQVAAEKAIGATL